GVAITSAAPLDRIPLHIPAGSILPLGPAIEYAGQATDPIELRVYPGANADFNLYEDEGDSYRYESGAHAIIPIHWDNATRTLTVGARRGSYPGVPPTHTFDVVIVHAEHGTGGDATEHPDRKIEYSGSKLDAKF